MAVGIYISVPFCRSKCSYCNFASGVFSQAVFANYVEKLCADIAGSPQIGTELGGELEFEADSIYLGGGTPTVLEPAHLERIFAAVRQTFQVAPDAEITTECAPGTLTQGMLETLLHSGVNRASLGVQSFLDEEARAVGRLHTRATTLDDIQRLRAAGISNISVDLIAGLPHQTAQSWRESLDCLIDLGVPHASVYMLEVDDESRLGRELIAGGTRYHAHFVPGEEATADLYLEACARLEGAGIRQYEISNFAREGMESRHNLKYWTRQPYLGFGVDAHSMLPAVSAADLDAVRFATPDSLENYVANGPLTRTAVSLQAAREEELFLGLRLTRGVDLAQIALRYGLDPKIREIIADLQAAGFMDQTGETVRLTARGRLLSNEVFERFLNDVSPAARSIHKMKKVSD